MSRSRHTEAEIIAALKQVEAGRKVEDVAREVGVSQAHDLRMEGEVRRDGSERGAGSVSSCAMRTRLKKLVADLSLDKEMLKSVIAKNGWSS